MKAKKQKKVVLPPEPDPVYTPGSWGGHSINNLGGDSWGKESVAPGAKEPQVNEHSVARAIPSMEQFSPTKMRKKALVRVVEAGSSEELQTRVNEALGEIFAIDEKPDIFSVDSFANGDGGFLFTVITYFTNYATMPTVAPNS